MIRYPELAHVKTIYDVTSSSSNPMRRLIVDLWYDMGEAS